jgi:hypothetical protein
LGREQGDRRLHDATSLAVAHHPGDTPVLGRKGVGSQANKTENAEKAETHTTAGAAETSEHVIAPSNAAATKHAADTIK